MGELTNKQKLVAIRKYYKARNRTFKAVGENTNWWNVCERRTGKVIAHSLSLDWVYINIVKGKLNENS